jgi:hypothetical protein
MPDQQEARERPRGCIPISEGGGGALAAMEAAKQQRCSDKVHAQERVLELYFQRRGACAWRPKPCWPPQGAVMAVLRRVAAVDTSTAAIAENPHVLQQMVGGGGTYDGEGAWFTPVPPLPPQERPLGP